MEGAHRNFLAAMIAFGIGFIVFMVSVDVPMYWSRWQEDLSSGQTYLSLAQGLFDASRSYKVSFDWVIWREEIPWMTLYFTVAVWVSIYLTLAPNFKIAEKRQTK